MRNPLFKGKKKNFKNPRDALLEEAMPCYFCGRSVTHTVKLSYKTVLLWCAFLLFFFLFFFIAF